MRIDRRHVIFDVTAFAFELLTWMACIAGPYVLLVRRHTLLSLAASALAIALFAASFRWRSGYAMLPGCLGMTLLIGNTATICFGMAILVKDAGHGTLPQIAAALTGIPSVIIHVMIVEAILTVVLGPKQDPSDDHTTTPENGG